MSVVPGPAELLVVCDPHSPARAAVETYLQENGSAAAAWYAARDVDDVDRRVRAGGVRVVVFPSAAELLDVVWTDGIALDAWLAAGARIVFADTTSSDFSAACLPLIWTSWQRWRRRRRRQQVVAGLILSAVAVAGAFPLLLVCR